MNMLYKAIDYYIFIVLG